MKCAPGLAGLHAYGLDIKHVTVDGQDAGFELRPHVEEALPEQVFEGAFWFMPAVSQAAPLIAEVASVGAHVKVQVNCSSAKCLTAGLCMGPYSGHARGLCMRAGPSGSHLAATVADHTFFQYERTLQREYNPELSISLPPLQAAGSQAALAAQPQSAVSEEPPAPSASAQPAAVPAPAAPPAPAPGAAAEQASKGVGELRTVLVKVSYELRQPATGLHFSRSHVHTGNQV